MRSGTCVNNLSVESDTAKAIKVTLQSVVAAVIIVAVVSSLFSSSSMTSMWLILSQVQLFMLLILTRAYLPEDIKVSITGTSFVLNPFGLISLPSLSSYDPVAKYFDFSLTDSLFESLEISSCSIIYNTHLFV